MTNNPGVYEGHIEFHHVCVWLISSNEQLLGSSPMPNWLCKKQCIYAIDNTGDNLRIWQCLIISETIRCNRQRPAEDMMRDALNSAHEFYGNPDLGVRDVRLTKLIDFESIASRFRVNIRLYESSGKCSLRAPFQMLISAYIKSTASTSRTWTS